MSSKCVTFVSLFITASLSSAHVFDVWKNNARFEYSYEMSIVKSIKKVGSWKDIEGRELPTNICKLSSAERRKLCSDLLRDYIDLDYDYSSWRRPKEYTMVRLDNNRSTTKVAIQCSMDPPIYIHGNIDPMDRYFSRIWIVLRESDVPFEKRASLVYYRLRPLSEFLRKSKPLYTRKSNYERTKKKPIRHRYPASI